MKTFEEGEVVIHVRGGCIADVEQWREGTLHPATVPYTVLDHDNCAVDEETKRDCPRCSTDKEGGT